MAPRQDWLATAEHSAINSEFEVSRIKFFRFFKAKTLNELVTCESDPHASKILAISSLENTSHECEFFSLGANGSLIQWMKFFKNVEEGEVIHTQFL